MGSRPKKINPQPQEKLQPTINGKLGKFQNSSWPLTIQGQVTYSNLWCNAVFTWAVTDQPIPNDITELLLSYKNEPRLLLQNFCSAIRISYDHLVRCNLHWQNRKKLPCGKTGQFMCCSKINRSWNSTRTVKKLQRGKLARLWCRKSCAVGQQESILFSPETDVSQWRAFLTLKKGIPGLLHNDRTSSHKVSLGEQIHEQFIWTFSD